MGNQANVHSESILLRKSQSSYSSAVEFQYNVESVASEYSTLVARKGMSIFPNDPSRATLQSLHIGLLNNVIRQSGIQSLNTRRE